MQQHAVATHPRTAGNPMPCFYFCIYGVKCICVDVTAQGNKRYTSLYWPRNIAMAQWQERGGSAVSSHSNPGSLHRMDVTVMTAHWARICEHKTGTLSYKGIREDTAFIKIILQQDITNSICCAFYSEQRPNECFGGRSCTLIQRLLI